MFCNTQTLVRTFHFVLLATVVGLCSNQACSQTGRLGIIAPLAHDSLLFAAGFRFTGTTVGSLLGPEITDQVFLEKVESIKQMKCKLYLCNVLFPGSIKIAGPNVDENKALDYLESVLARAQVAGIKNITLGSGGARRIPDGYDKKLAMTKFIPLCKKMAALAKRYDVTIILENLNSAETNFINTLADAAHIVRKVDHKNFRLNADIYHMLKEGEPADEIVRAGRWIVYCELAEKEGRSLPGVHGEDFRSYLAALKKISYKGVIMLEANFVNAAEEFPKAFTYLTGQWRDVSE